MQSNFVLVHLLRLRKCSILLRNDCSLFCLSSFLPSCFSSRGLQSNNIDKVNVSKSPYNSSKNKLKFTLHLRSSGKKPDALALAKSDEKTAMDKAYFIVGRVTNTSYLFQMCAVGMTKLFQPADYQSFENCYSPANHIVLNMSPTS